MSQICSTVRALAYCLLILALFGTTALAQAQKSDSSSVEHMFSARMFSIGFRDVGRVVTSPVRWKGNDWLRFGVVGGVVFGTAVLLDYPIRDFSQRNRSRFSNNLARDFKPFGSYYPFIVESAFMLEGELFHDPRARAFAVDAFAAGIISTVVIDQPLKYLIGRRRPYEGRGHFSFSPFTYDASFPGGHSTHAFMLATVVSMHYPKTWVKIASYSVATLVVFDRVNDDVHFVSDCVAGAAIGIAVGRAVVLFNRQLRKL